MNAFFCCSPSGCTFWGKKPWSRKKKVLWQMGTLIGAPVGIALAAGVVLPAMMIGIPIYVGGRVSFILFISLSAFFHRLSTSHVAYSGADLARS